MLIPGLLEGSRTAARNRLGAVTLASVLMSASPKLIRDRPFRVGPNLGDARGLVAFRKDGSRRTRLFAEVLYGWVTRRGSISFAAGSVSDDLVGGGRARRRSQ